MSHLLEIQDLKVTFGGLNALSGLNFHVDEGEIVSVIGPNGAGKTTFFNAISGLVEATEGEILFEGESVLGLEPHQVTSLGIARTFQNVRLFPNMTILENVMVSQHCRTRQLVFGALMQTKAFKQEEREIRERAEAALGFFGSRLVGYRLEQAAFMLSYANRRRLEIARAMATQPQLILLDEPVSALDVSVQAQVLNLLEDLKQRLGLTYLFIAHHLAVVRHVSDRVAVMYLGRIVEVAKRDDLYGQPLHPYTHALLSAIPIPDPVRERTRSRIALTGEIPSPTKEYVGCRFYERCPARIDRCQSEDPPLTEHRPGHFAACWVTTEDGLPAGAMGD